MITTMIFDLDGTLVQTERLKAISYARAAAALRPELAEEAVVTAFKEVVGLSRREVAQRLLDRFDLSAPAATRQAELGVSTPWQAYVQIRLAIYEEMLSDPAVLRDHRWPHTMALLHTARQNCRHVALATMSRCAQVQHVLEALELASAFDFVATRDDIMQGKPDPEIYRLVVHELGVAPGACLVIEDSPAGVEAALAAGMRVLAVSTPFTRERLHTSGLLAPDQIVDDPEQLAERADVIIQQSRQPQRR